MRIPKWLVVASLVAAPLLAPTVTEAQAWKTDRPQLSADSLALGRKYTAWLLGSMADSLYARMDSAGKQAGGGLQAIQDQMAQFAIQAGPETEKMEERWMLRRGRTQYVYQARFANAPEPLVIRFVLAPNGEIAGIGIGLASAVPPADPKPPM